VFDYLREVMPELNWDEEEARFKYDGGGFKGPPHWDADYGQGDSSLYTMYHPDTQINYDVSKEDFMKVYEACVVGPSKIDTAKYATAAREVLKKYVRKTK
jgi:hypothetical protein